ncbi:MAG: acyl-CoA thioesterase [Moraxella sp.]|nr:acyl-CoA thioesterase [Moraxella sp.]
MHAVESIFEPILMGDKRPALLKDYAVVHIQPVAWGEMDAFNHLNNVAYYRYAESARISYLRAIGLTFARSDLLTILASSSCQYLRPVSYPDTLFIGVRVKKLGNTSMIFEYAFVSHTQQAVVATAEAVIVRTNEKMQKQPWSEREHQLLREFEGKEF